MGQLPADGAAFAKLLAQGDISLNAPAFCRGVLLTALVLFGFSGNALAIRWPSWCGAGFLKASGERRPEEYRMKKAPRTLSTQERNIEERMPELEACSIESVSAANSTGRAVRRSTITVPKRDEKGATFCTSASGTARSNKWS